jgi:hypothetical protein
MKTLSARTKKMLSYMRKNPRAKAKEVATEFGVNVGAVYNLRHRVKASWKRVKAKRIKPSLTRKVDPRMPVFKDTPAKPKPMPLPESYNDVTSEVEELMTINTELRNQVLDCKAVISYLENVVVALIKKSN